VLHRESITGDPEFLVAGGKGQAYLLDSSTLEVPDPQLEHKAQRGSNDPDMTYIIVQPCIETKDASCVDVCPVDCIYEGEDQYYIHPEECIDCGACVPECPVEAIFPDDEVPDKWKEYIAKNYERFEVPLPS